MSGFLGKLFGPLADLIGGALELFHSMGAPWWLSIVFLTVLVRGVLFPLTVRQVKNMRKMQELRPEMDRIRARYKKDRQKQQEAMMELYQKRKVNPAAGFFPILIQMPVFITMYRVVRYHEENFLSFTSGGMLWFSDLTHADPYFILPVLSASILLVSAEITSKNVNPRQKMMMRGLPLVFTAFIARFPAGLLVCWVASNTFTLMQNYLIYHRNAGDEANSQDNATSAASARESVSLSSGNRKSNRKSKRKHKNRKKRQKKR